MRTSKDQFHYYYLQIVTCTAAVVKYAKYRNLTKNCTRGRLPEMAMMQLGPKSGGSLIGSWKTVILFNHKYYKV